MKLTLVFANAQYEGVHHYPEAPDEVAYIRQPHRHVFHVRVEVEVFNDDREVEFIILKHQVNKYIQKHLDEDGVWQMGRMSCEQVAKGIVQHLYTVVPRAKSRSWSVTVDEDGENGATVLCDAVED